MFFEGEKFVVLRRQPSGDMGGGPFAMEAPGAAAATDLKVEVAELEAADLADLRRDPTVTNILPSMPMHLIRPIAEPTEVEPADAGDAAWGITAIGADVSNLDGSGVTVAVLDTGIDANHSAFAGLDIVESDFTGEGNGDVHGHGTHTAGTVCGSPVGGTRIGVAPGVDILLVGKVLGQGSGSTDTVFRGIEWALTEGAQVVSMSLGIDFPGFVKDLIARGFPEDLATSVALQGYRANVLAYDSLAEWALNRGGIGTGAVLVAASGNESKRQINPNFEVGSAPPSVATGIIAVGAVGSPGPPHDALTVADFSNTGPAIVAPGVDVVSARAGGGLASSSGTSMATPHVAGVAALWIQKQIDQLGFTEPRSVSARIMGQASTARLAVPIDHLDIGGGLVQAPQS